MLGWLLGLGPTPKYKPKQLQDIISQLLASGQQQGDTAFQLNERELKRLCNAAKDQLLKDSSLVEIQTTTSSVVVVGDLHGQFSDLQRIFERLGRPGSDAKVWVFLGDYVDRGPCGLEIIATLFALKLLHPSQVFLLRGNHECSEITVLFGFCGECQRRSTLSAWETIMQVFDALPLAALLNNKVFLCHGGISPHLGHPQEVNAICRPLDMNPNSEGLPTDLLWADPSALVSGWRPNPRGVSCVFGLDAAQAWLRRHGLRAIVRAHMVQQAGFEVLGANEVMTVFSATDYRESGNTGAVLVIAASLDFEFVTFPSPIDRQNSFSTVEGADTPRCGPDNGPRLSIDPLGMRVTVPPAKRSPFAAMAEAVEGTELSRVASQDVAEEQVIMRQMSGDGSLALVVETPSESFAELDKLTGGARVPADALLHTSTELPVM